MKLQAESGISRAIIKITYFKGTYEEYQSVLA